MLTQSSKKIDVPITVLSDWWLLVCIPLMLLNVLAYTCRRTLLAIYFALLRKASTLVLQVLSIAQVVNIPLLIGVNALTSLALLLLAPSISNPVAWLMIVLVAISTMMCIQTCKMAIEFRDGNRTDLVMNLTTLHNRDWSPVQHPLPDGLHVQTLSQGTWLGSIMVCLLVCVQFVILLLAETGSVSFWMSVHALLLVSLLIDFEMVEHLAAHARNGVLVQIEKGGSLAWVLFALEKIRINLVWPLYYWAPKRYFLTHTHHHHVENNGPADWQSTLRFDLTSLADFSKSLLWLQSSLLLPLDTMRYFHALGRRRHLKKLLISSVHNVAVIGLVFMLEPVFAMLLFFLYLSMAWVFHSFIFAWHGFHDAAKPYDVIASNNSTGHYGHHKKPGLHLFSPHLRDVYKHDVASTSQAFPVHQSAIAFDVISRNWLLIQSLLWQKKYSIIRELIRSEHLADDEIHRLVSGVKLRARHPLVKRVDERVSATVGAVLEKALRLIAPAEHRVFLSQLTGR